MELENIIDTFTRAYTKIESSLFQKIDDLYKPKDTKPRLGLKYAVTGYSKSDLNLSIKSSQLIIESKDKKLFKSIELKDPIKLNSIRIKVTNGMLFFDAIITKEQIYEILDDND